jgi:hypothetical protein
MECNICEKKNAWILVVIPIILIALPNRYKQGKGGGNHERRRKNGTHDAQNNNL